MTKILSDRGFAISLVRERILLATLAYDDVGPWLISVCAQKFSSLTLLSYLKRNSIQLTALIKPEQEYSQATVQKNQLTIRALKKGL